MSTESLRTQLAEVLPERPFRIALWDGTQVPSTTPDGPVFTLRSPVALGHMLRAPGQLGLGRAYVSGALEVDDIDKVLRLLDGYSPPPIDTKAKLRLARAAVEAGALAPGTLPLLAFFFERQVEPREVTTSSIL